MRCHYFILVMNILHLSNVNTVPYKNPTGQGQHV